MLVASNFITNFSNIVSGQESASVFWKEPNSKHFRFCMSISLCCNSDPVSKVREGLVNN